MGHQNIYKTLSVASMMPKPMLGELCDLLITNRSYLLDREKTADAFRTRFSSHSVISEIVHRLLVLGKDQYYTLAKFPNKTAALSESLDMTFISLDTKQMKDVIPDLTTTLKHVPLLDDKLVINISDVTKASGDFSDVSQFHYRVVRDFLSRSFYTSNGNIWLSPALVSYVAKVYSMTIGGQVARLFGLNPDVQMFIQTVFATFFVNQMTSDTVTATFMKVHGKSMGLQDPIQVQQILSFGEETLGHPIPNSLEDVFKIIDAYDHSQLKNTSGSRLNRPVLNARFASIYPERPFSFIALAYPPYFLFLIMLVVANVPIGLSYPMKNMNLLREGKTVMGDLLKNTSVFNIV